MIGPTKLLAFVIVGLSLGDWLLFVYEKKELSSVPPGPIPYTIPPEWPI